MRGGHPPLEVATRLSGSRRHHQPSLARAVGLRGGEADLTHVVSSFGDAGVIRRVEPRMWAVFYVLTISVVAAVLFLVVGRFEPDHRYSLVLKFLIVCLAAAAIARCLRLATRATHSAALCNLLR